MITSLNSECAMRAAALPLGLPGKYLLRSRRSGRYLEPRLKPCTFTIGTPIKAPANLFGSISWNTRRTISMPFNSSPWTAAIRQTVGPGAMPLATSTGVETGTPSNNSVADQDRRCEVPGATSAPRIVNDSACPSASVTAFASGPMYSCSTLGSSNSSAAAEVSLERESISTVESSSMSMPLSDGSIAASPA